MSGSKARLEAIDAVKNYKAPDGDLPDRRGSPGEIFGENVFTKAVMQKRLPKPVFKSLMAHHRALQAARSRPWPTWWPRP